MDLAATKTELAALLDAIPGAGMSIRPRPVTGALKTGDGWIVTRRVEPGPRFGDATLVTFEVLIVAGVDEAAAEAYSDAHSAVILRTVLHSDLPTSQQSITQQSMVAGQAATPVYVLVLTAAIEVE